MSCRPIHDAVEANSISTVRVLLCAGADVSMQKYSGETVLHLVKSLEMKRFIEGLYLLTFCMFLALHFCALAVVIIFAVCSCYCAFVLILCCHCSDEWLN